MIAKIWRSNFSVSSRSSFPPDIANSEHVLFENDNVFNINKWSIPKLLPKDIYTNSSWLKSSFWSEYFVKTVEKLSLFLEIIRHFNCFIKDSLKVLSLKVISFCTLD